MAVRRFLVAGRYRLHEPVGAGGMGRVWMARDEMLDRDVAVKEFVPPDWMTDAERARLRDRTLREARSAARLSHPHVVRIYDVVHADDLPWIVMEYIPSRSLHQVIKEDGPYSPAAAARIGLAVLDALNAAHRAGVLHRDVKPHNVLIGLDGRVVLTDFGLATFVDDGSVTGPGLVVGSPQYVSPERARDGASTVESDLWSLGATLYAAVEGRSPYARESAMATLMALATEEPDPPMFAGPLTPVLNGLLRRDPGDRLTARQVEERLRAIAGPDGGHSKAIARRAVVPAPRRPGEAASAHPGTSAVATTVPDAAPPVAERDGARIAVDEAGARPQPRRGVRAVRVPPVQRDRQGSAEPMSAVPSGRRRRFRLWPVLAAGVVAVALLTGIVANWTVQRNNTDRQSAQTTPPSFVPAAAVGGFTPVACQQPASANLPRTPQLHARRTVGDFALPPSWSEFVDASGFRVGVPDGWTYEKVGTTVCFRDPHDIRFLSVDPARNPAGDPVKACQTEAARLVRAGQLPHYTLIDLHRATLQITAADWEYTWTDPTDVRMHAKTRWFKSGGKAFALSWATRDFEWTFTSAPYDLAISSFSAT
jgi:tRNA A-37 threonylcarbamoyl transferase component Bud32